MAMRATHVLTGDEAAGAVLDHVKLDFDGRHRRRMTLRTEGGEELLLDLAETTPWPMVTGW
jgi:urease accessory protein UreE